MPGFALPLCEMRVLILHASSSAFSYPFSFLSRGERAAPFFCTQETSVLCICMDLASTANEAPLIRWDASTGSGMMRSYTSSWVIHRCSQDLLDGLLNSRRQVCRSLWLGSAFQDPLANHPHTPHPQDALAYNFICLGQEIMIMISWSSCSCLLVYSLDRRCVWTNINQ